MLILRTTGKDGKSYGGFQWPQSGEVVAPDWDPAPVCGGGLHGLAHGMGDGELLNWGIDALWWVVDALWWVVDADDVVDIDGDKVKFPRCTIRYRGDREGATQYIYAHDPDATAVVGLVFAGGDRATVTGGYGATVTGGDRSTVTGGYGAILQLRHWDGSRYRIITAYVGEDGIEPNTQYRLDDKGQFVPAALEGKANP